MIRVTQAHPRWLANYGPGWIGFVSRHDNWISEGINWFSRWEAISRIPVSHCFNVVGMDATVEALAPGVVFGSLNAYLQNLNVCLLVRQPRFYTESMAARITHAAGGHVGEKYNVPLVLAHLRADTFIGHALNRLTGGRFKRQLCERADKPDQSICSKNVTLSLQQGEYGHPGNRLAEKFPPLLRHPAVNEPIDLFEDETLFEPGAFELVPEGHPIDS